MMKFTIYSLLLPTIQPFAAVLSPWLPMHFAGIEREGCSLGTSHSAAGVVDNFIRMFNLSSAYFLGSVYNYCKCMILLINSLKRTKLFTIATLYNGRYVK
jgi:hypothetical protein